MNIQEKFLQKVELVPFIDCWVWIGALHSQAKMYGNFRIGKPQKAHRASWLLFNGDIPNSFHVLHKCDNPWCVNPKHLFLGTNADNIKDKVKKGRSSRLSGENHPMYGKKHTDLAKKSMSKARLGKTHSQQTKQKMSDSQYFRWSKVKLNETN